MRHLSTGPVMLWEGSVQYHREGWRYPRNGLLSQSSDVILVICTGQTSLTVHLDATALLHALGFTGKENNEQEWIAAIRCLMARTSRGPLKNGLYRGVVVDDQLHRCASGCRRFDQPASPPAIRCLLQAKCLVLVFLHPKWPRPPSRAQGPTGVGGSTPGPALLQVKPKERPAAAARCWRCWDQSGRARC